MGSHGEEVFMSIVDCRGLACPEPVMTTKKALDQLKEGNLIVIVNNGVSCNNVERFALSQGCTVEVEKKGEDYHLHIRKEKSAEAPKETGGKVVVYINSQFLGVGEEALGTLLMRAFLKTLAESEARLYRIIFINSGVRLTSEGSDVLESLKSLSEKGVEVLSCGTCLDFYGLKEKVRVGIVSNMYDIAKTLMEADRLIRP
jgi:selenium metabolism protein YedF